MELSNLRTLFFKWLPGFLCIIVLIGLVILFAQKILPNLQNYQILSANIILQQAVISTQSASQNNDDNQVILQSLIEDAQGKLDTISDSFLTQSEADQVLDWVYRYAYWRGARIISLQAQQPTLPSDLPAVAPYSTSLYQLQVTGSVASLIDFIAHFREASVPSVNILDMNVVPAESQALLTMTLQIHTSPYASGHALSELPPFPAIPDSTMATPSLTTTPTEIVVTDTPTALATATPTALPTLTAIPTLTATPTATFAARFHPTEVAIVCAGALPTRLRVGDVAIVHFSGLGALRVLSDPNGNVMSARTQAYDQHHLEIIAGPVCANGSYYWYIRNLSQENALGWVAEGSADERWLCPEADPVCSP